MIDRVVQDARKSVAFGVFGAVGGAAGSGIGEITDPDAIYYHSGTWDLLRQTIPSTSARMAIIGAVLCVALIAAHRYHTHREVSLSDTTFGLAAFGALAGAVGGLIGETLYQVLGASEFVRALAWAAQAGLLGLVLGRKVPNLPQRAGLLGGCVGGFVGALFFIAFRSAVGGELGRLVGAGIAGFCIGVMIVLAEAALARAWLEVRYGPNEVRTVSLGRERTSLGGDSKRCSVFLRGADPVAFEYWVQEGRVLCATGSGGAPQEVALGDVRTVGGVELVVCGSRAVGDPSASGGPAPAAGPSASPAPAASATASPPTAPVAVRSTPATERMPGGAASADGARYALEVPGWSHPLTPDGTLAHDAIPGLDPDTPGGPVAEVTRNPNDPAVLGLRNRSTTRWVVHTPGGETIGVEPGRNLRIAAGTKLQLGWTEAEIVEA